MYGQLEKKNNLKTSSSNKSKTNLDSFYLSIRPALIICKLLGHCTLQNIWTNDARNLTYKRFGAIIWPIVIVLLDFYEIMVPERKTNNIMINVFLHFARTVVNILLIHWTDKNLLEVIQNINKFDEFYLYRPAEGSKRRGLIGFLIIITVMLVFTCFLFIKVGYSHRAVCFSILNISARYISIILFIIFCNELTIRFKFISKLWIKKEKDIITFRQEEFINQLRRNHGHLRLIVSSMSDSLGIRVITFLISMTYEVIINFFHRQNLSLAYVFSCSMYHTFDTILLFALLTATNKLYEKVSIK